jgi:hypothetical protein
MTPSAVTRSSAELRTTFAREPITNNNKKISPGLAFEEKPQLTHPQRNFLRVGERLLSGLISNWLFGQWLPVKIALNGAFLMIWTLVRNELRIKASCDTDKSLFSVAIEARIWLYVGLCCDAGGHDSVTVPAVATHRSFPRQMN